jgi:hypothetical protein
MSGSVSSPPKKFRTWTSRSNDTVYQAAADIFIHAYGDEIVECFTDPFPINPPTTKRQGCSNTGSYAATGSSLMCVRKNDYWKVTGASVVWELSLR